MEKEKNKLLKVSIICAMTFFGNLVFGMMGNTFSDMIGLGFIFLFTGYPAVLISSVISVVSILLIITGLIKKEKINWLVLPFIISTTVALFYFIAINK